MMDENKEINERVKAMYDKIDSGIVLDYLSRTSNLAEALGELYLSGKQKTFLAMMITQYEQFSPQLQNMLQEFMCRGVVLGKAYKEHQSLMKRLGFTVIDPETKEVAPTTEIVANINNLIGNLLKEWENSDNEAEAILTALGFPPKGGK